MSAFEYSQNFFTYASAVYALSIVLFAIYMVIDRKWVTNGALYSLLVAWIFHTLALLFRWYESGIGHPPWSNLYESLVFFGWGVTTMSLFAMKYFGPKARFSGLFSAACTFLALGMATFYHNQGIEPLVPALQSKWILFHVFNGCLSYALFIVASTFGFLYLVKAEEKDENFCFVFSALAMFFIWIVAGNKLFSEGVWEIVKVVTNSEGKLVPLEFTGADGKLKKEMVPIPAGGPLLIISWILFMFTSLSWVMRAFGLFKRIPSKFDRNLFLAGSAFLLLALLNLFFRSSTHESISPTGSPFRTGILSMTVGMNLFLAMVFFFRTNIENRLPDKETLDSITYKLIFIGFPFQTLLLVTGAIWAHSAWGRYWGWDPKEVWALITWAYYAVYLHLRMIGGWTGKKTAIIAALGFGIVIFAFLGVNIVLSGLHSYGAA